MLEHQSAVNQDSDSNSAAKRVLALDIGTRRVGVAVSDELNLTVRPLPSFLRTNWKRFLQIVKQLCSDYNVRLVVIGLPLRFDGSEGTAAQEARRLAKNFSASLQVPVVLQDERLTSHAAEEDLRAQGRSRKSDRTHADSYAAAIILRDYLQTSVW